MKLTRALAVAALTAAATLGWAAPAAAVEPTPQCESNGNKPPCWEYYSWYWTYERCHEVGKQQVSAHARYDDYTCDGGATVYLWLHRV
ncbi:hypothetical protein ACIBFB_05640 [Nocardiopsis sp. NPDC050513]|uniref:hypothetical protein n=1 Tax=Nocardiopsis sp. NPDC050513 TaxID=3364338 RepID=UPI0037974483